MIDGKGKSVRRMLYGIVFGVLLIIEVLIALFCNDAIIRPYVGDMLVVVVVYCLVRIFIPEKNSLMPIWVFLFAAGVEGLQYLELVKKLGLEQNTFMRTILGSVFDWKDIWCYGAGCILLEIGRAHV